MPPSREYDAGNDEEENYTEERVGDVVEFSEDDEEPAKPLGGRRLKREKEMKKKMRAGTFGEYRFPCMHATIPCVCSSESANLSFHAESMGLSGPVIKAIKRKGYRLPTPIQRRTLPIILQGVDVIGMARTGSGKTAAFVIPMIER